MSVLLFAEHSQGTVKKPVLQAATLANDLAAKMGTDVVAVAIGPGAENAASTLGEYGVSKVYTVSGIDAFNDQGYSAAVAQAAKTAGAKVVVLAQTYNGKAIAPRLSIKLDAALLSGVISLPDPANGFQVQKLANTGKGVETIESTRDSVVITVRSNAYKERRDPKPVENISLNFDRVPFRTQVLGEEHASSGISITEAEIVVSGGRGLKGPENWTVLLELADALKAGTACSKPVADMDWRPHHEHVGQTGIQIGPNLYIAMGISGAIQHLAGVNSSKNIVVINKDPEAPFFKIADYGIVGDLFEVVPKMTQRVKELKG
ncbi:MAG: electron transfer flavoprotein subunit alpha/FixB family protein [Bacteroidia bacterium]|nr:electron transfer flavoprotein subunit alpha/FixB family protein [Bacteroidia bacterium]